MQTSRMREPTVPANPFAMPGAVEGKMPEVAVSQSVERVLGDIEQAEQSISREDFLVIIGRVFEHSTEDGMKLAERLSFTPDELFDACATPGFALKHPRVFGQVMNFAGRHKDDLGSEYQALEKAEQSSAEAARVHPLKLKTALARSLYAQMEEAYAEVFSARKLKARAASGEVSSETDKLTESYLAHLELAWQGGYYCGPLREYVEAQVDPKVLKSKKWKGWQERLQALNIVTTDELEEMCKDLQLDFEETENAIKKHKYVLYGDLLKYEKGAAVSSLKADIEEDLEEGERLELNREVNRYEIVGDVVESEAERYAELTPEFEGRILDFAERALKSGVSIDDVAVNLAGLDSPRAWDLREKLINKGARQNGILMGMAGLDSAKAWEMREKYLQLGEKRSISFSLAGLDSAKAWEMRENFLTGYFDGDLLADEVSLSLIGVDSSRAWEMREELLKGSFRNKNSVALSLSGLDSPKAWEMRERFFQDPDCGADLNDSLALSLSGLDSPKAWEMRKELTKRGVIGYFIPVSLAGLDSDRAWKMRQDYIDDENKGTGEYFLAESLVGLDSPKAWELREKLLSEGIDRDRVVKSLGGKYDNFVWQLVGKNKKKEKTHTSEIDPEFADKALDYMEWLMKDGKVPANAVVRSLVGLDSVRAWELRDRLMTKGEVRTESVLKGMAGLDSALAWRVRSKYENDPDCVDEVAISLAGLDTPKAMKMREDLLAKGAGLEAIVEGLYGVDTPKSWEMREQLFNQGEGTNQLFVIRSLAGLDSPKSWEMREKYIDKGFARMVALTLTALDSPKAWEMRGRLRDAGADDPVLALSLTGLDSDKAWEMRERIIGTGLSLEQVAMGLAGLNSERAWEMRVRLIKQFGVSETSIVEGLFGSGVTFAWQTVGKEKKKQEHGHFPEIPPEFEQEALDLMRKCKSMGVSDILIAKKLAGFDSEQAWELRSEFIGKAAGRDIVGLAGLDNPKAWELREKYYTTTHTKSFLLLSLMGLDTPRAWEMREELYKHKGEIPFVIDSLTAVDTPRAWEMREDALDKGLIGLDVFFESMAGTDSAKSWEIREKYFASGDSLVIYSLIGLDTQRAWEMREEEYRKGQEYWVMSSLVGLGTPRAWEMRDRFLKDHPNSEHEFIQSVAFVNDARAKEVRNQLLADQRFSSLVYSLVGKDETYGWMMQKREKKETNEKLDLLNLVHDPDERGIKRYFEVRAQSEEERKKKERSLVGQSRRIAEMFNRAMSEIPDAFLKTMGAKRDRGSDILGQKLISKLFPEVFARENQTKNGEGFFGFLGEGREPAATSPEDYLSFREFDSFEGGSWETMHDERKVFESREKVTGLFVTGLFGTSDARGNWRRVYLPLTNRPVGENKETTITLPNVNKGADVILPKSVDASLVPERVRGIKKNGAEVELNAEQDSLGMAKVRDLPQVEKVAYSLNMPQMSAPMEEVSINEYNTYRDKIIKNYSAEFARRLTALPEEVDVFLSSPEYIDLSPRERVMAIEEFVRSQGFYDFKNGEVARHKTGRSLEDKMIISEMRMEELRSRDPKNAELQQKRWAGVCADFAEITCAILRQAGFLAGVAQGFALHDETTARVRQAHATAFVIWPDGLSGNRSVVVDGTAGGSDPRLRAITLPSLKERVVAAEKEEAEELEKSEKVLDQYLEILKSGDTEAIRKLQNGKLETALNVILKYGVKKSHTEMLVEMLNFYWYGGVERMDEMQAEIELKKTMESYLASRREKVAEAGAAKPGGKQLFEMVEEFVKRFKRGKVGNDKQALDKLEHITELASDQLEPMEKKAMIAVVTYLRGKGIGR